MRRGGEKWRENRKGWESGRSWQEDGGWCDVKGGCDVKKGAQGGEASTALAPRQQVVGGPLVDAGRAGLGELQDRQRLHERAHLGPAGRAREGGQTSGDGGGMGAVEGLEGVGDAALEQPRHFRRGDEGRLRDEGRADRERERLAFVGGVLWGEDPQLRQRLRVVLDQPSGGGHGCVDGAL